MTSKEWETKTLEGDQKIKKRIKKYRERSSRGVILGLLVAFFAFETLNDVIKKTNAVVKEYSKTVGKKNMSWDVISGGFSAVGDGVDGKLAMTALVLILLMFAVFFWAIMARNKADTLDIEMSKWMPSEDEINDIRKRFDNEFVRGVMSNISASETESVIVSLDGIQIENNDGLISWNFNREGFRKLTNYESKQLAFFIGCEAFPNGFIIHQLKKNAAVYDRYASGYTEVGEIWEKAPEESEITRKNVRWLLKEISKVPALKKLKPQEEPDNPVTVEGGHIVINKGYTENSEKYKEL